MRDSTWNFLLVGLLCLLCLPASEAAGPDSPETLVDTFVRAWNAHDMKVWGGLFAENGDFVSGVGGWLTGRAEIQANLERAHATYFKTTTLAASGTVVRLLGPDVAVLRFKTELTGRLDSEGKPAAPGRGLFLVVAVKQSDGWRIIAAQNTYRTVPQ